VSGTGHGQGPLLEALLGQFDRLKGFVMAMGLSVADAEDVLQDVSIQVLRQAARGSQDGNLKAWLFKVTVNRIRLAHRRQGIARRGNPVVPPDPPVQYLDAQHQTIRDEEARIIARALDEMDDSLRVPLVLRYFCDQDSSQIAEVLDLPASTVRSRLAAARLEMTRRLLEKGVEP
jgi:RNA polymerase sigma-70 factor (ECF subfamily)